MSPIFRLKLVIAFLVFSSTSGSLFAVDATNLLQNPDFAFHAFTNHRLGHPNNYSSHMVAFWNCESWGDIQVVREPHVEPAVRPDFSVSNLVKLSHGKRFWQFFTLPEAGLAHGEAISLSVHGYQAEPGQLVARIVLLKLDSEDGTWSPSQFELGDTREFPRQSRGELVVVKTYESSTETPGKLVLKIEGAEIIGKIHEGPDSSSGSINTIGVRVEFENRGASDDAWICAPALTRGDTALARPPQVSRSMKPVYQHLPRTMQKLWKGEPIHIVQMGSSIDRGSANPAMVLYDEDPASPTFKQPVSQRNFDGSLVGHPELDPYFGWWQHYFDYAGRLKRELMRRFDLPADKILLNVMACDGSCVGEAHSGLLAYCELSLPPNENTNGHRAGKTWQELYPALFERPEGTRPDLVIFGSGANEKTDTPDEVAVFEGTIRWIQRHYPNTEFLFCMFQNKGGYTPNAGDLQALALRYQIPMIDYGLAGDAVTRWCNPLALVPRDGHPQAAAHYLWYKQIEKAFQCWSPIETGQAQLQLPERVHPNTYGWEGEMITYDATSPRLNGNMFIFEDTAVNCWGDADDDQSKIFVDGTPVVFRRKVSTRDLRNSMVRHGNTRLGDRHIIEMQGNHAKLTAVDAKICPNRRWLGVENAQWQLNGAAVSEFASEWGAPCGTKQVVLQPGQRLAIDVPATDLSVAWVDASESGALAVTIDAQPAVSLVTDQPFTDQAGQAHFLENRHGFLNLPYGLHRVQLEAIDKPVRVLGIFTYDARSNQANERRLVGYASPGETVQFSQPFRARPLVICHGELHVDLPTITPTSVQFSGKGPGSYEIIGE